MNEFQLQIVTPDGLMYDGSAERVIVRTAEGDVGILANHIDYVAPVDIGVARIYSSDGQKNAACAGGLLTVSGGSVKLVASTFEWADDIDIDRAKAAMEKAKQKINTPNLSDYELRLAQVKLKKALARINASSDK